MKRSIIFGAGVLAIALLASPAFARAEGLTAGQVQAILTLLRSFEAPASLVQAVDDALNARPASPVAVKVASTIVLSPDAGESFLEGQPIAVSWSGGTEKVQIGIVDSTYETDKKVLGWLSLNEQPGSSFIWDGLKVSDITGTVSQSLSALSKGPYRILAISKDAKNNLCAAAENDCNYDVSNVPFSIMYSTVPGTFRISCTPSLFAAETGQTVTWEATTTGGTMPYLYTWRGSDGISLLPRRTPEGKFLDVIYYAPGQKTAGVAARDAKGQEGFVSCGSLVKITPAPALISDLMPNGGEYFALTKTSDPSEFMRVTWQSRLTKWGTEKLQVALVDTYGAECVMGSVPRISSEAFINLLEGFACKESSFVLEPGKYKVKVYLEGKRTTVFDISDSYITLVAPIEGHQSVTPSVSMLDSGGSVSFRFVAPPNTVKASLYIFCPYEITATAPNTCNRYIDVLPHVASSTDYSVSFKNSSSQAHAVTLNFYVYRTNNLNYGRGVSTNVTVLPVTEKSAYAISVLSPNGGETIYYDMPYVYRFSSTTPGEVDLTLVPYPPIDSSLVCKIATAVPHSKGSVSFTIPPTGVCAQGPAKTILGTYKLLATVRSGTMKLASDLSDAFFTVSATSTTPY